MSDIFAWTPAQEKAALNALSAAELGAAKPDALESATPRKISKVGIIGGGTMGAGIAVAMLNAEYSVVLIERDQGAADAGQQRILATLKRDLKSGRIDEPGYKARATALAATTDYSDLVDTHLVIEAVYEDLDVKRDVFAKIAEACNAKTIFATNTSYLNPQEIFQGVSGPERCVGLHFFSPANIMKLVEIIPIKMTSGNVLAAVFSLAGRCRKIPVQTGICDGFIGNRLLKVMRSQSERLLLSGATPQAIDKALRKFGMKMGPFEVQDLAGLDIAAYQRKAARERGEVAFAPVSDRLFTVGRLGRKSGSGWYDYDGANAASNCPEEVRIAIAKARTENPFDLRDWSDDQIVKIVLAAMLNEAAKILDEGIAQQPSDIDLVEVHGYGFPRARGGLAWFGTSQGLDATVDLLTEMNTANISEKPSAALIKWAKSPPALQSSPKR